NRPMQIAIDSSGNLYVADFISIRKLTPSGSTYTVSTITPAPAITFDPSNGGTGIAVDSNGNLYVDSIGSGGELIYAVTPSNDTSMIVAGSANDLPDGPWDGTALTRQAP
ncbi:MAG: hypothetical protein FWD64_03385, partial [Acidobacteriaceae bacterium]|nr:hypothetical protein [Acidobacteriaceae bacterium]